MGGSHRRRRAIGLVTCVLWLLGVEVLPNVHLADHHDDHTHDLDGSIVEHADHDHGSARRDHHGPSDHDEVEQAAGASHAAGGLAHRATALLDAPLPSHEPVDLVRAVWRIQLPVTSHLSSIALHRPTARGPPAT